MTGSRRGSRGRIASLGSAAVAAGLLLWTGAATAVERGGAAAGEPVAAGPVAAAQLVDLSRTFRAVYERVAPAVVQVHTVGAGRRRRPALPPQHPPVEPFRPFDDEVSGLGSGTVVRADGYILSNYHVIAGADSIRVTFADRRTTSATVVGVDSLIDIAVLKVDLDQLPVASLGDSRDLQIGDWVLAIGFPLGLGTTLTHGIVSALGRQVNIIDSAYGIESFIQTNAVINPGNSGGPLLNLRGEVIGVNTAISTRTGYYMGYGLAVPIELVAEALRDVLEYGRVVRGYLGVNMDEVTAALMARRGLVLDAPRGVLLEPVDGYSPAARAGLLDGDVLLAVEGQPVDHPNQVQTLIYSRDPGEEVSLRLLRDGVEQQVVVTLGEREEDRRLARGGRRLEELGLQVAALSAARAAALGFGDDVAAAAGLAPDQPGVVVVAVTAGSPAAARGVAVGDIITEVDDLPVGTPDDVRRSVADLGEGESTLLWLWRPEQGVDVRFLRRPP